MKIFIDSQFNYCPLAWMFHSWQLNTKINKLHERALRIAYLAFQQSLDLDKFYYTHHRNLQNLAVEMYKIKKDLVPTYKRFFFFHIRKRIQPKKPTVLEIIPCQNCKVWQRNCYIEIKRHGNFFQI